VDQDEAPQEAASSRPAEEKIQWGGVVIDSNHALPTRSQALVFRKYMDAMHESLRSRDGRIQRLARQLEESRAEVQILRLAPPREGDGSDYELYQAELARSDRDHLLMKDRMLQMYDEREGNCQRSIDQLCTTIRVFLQRLEALLAVSGSDLPFHIRQEIESIIEAACNSLALDQQPNIKDMGASDGDGLGRKMVDENEIICKRKTIDEMTREIEMLQRENETLQLRLDAKHLEAEQSIQKALTSAEEQHETQKDDLISQLRTLEAYADEAMQREQKAVQDEQRMVATCKQELDVKDKELETASSEIKALKNEIAVLQKENTAVSAELDRQAENSEAILRSVREDYDAHLKRKEERTKGLLEALDQSRQEHLKLMSLNAERTILAEIFREPVPTQELSVMQSKERLEVERLRHDSASALQNVRIAHETFAATVQHKLHNLRASQKERSDDNTKTIQTQAACLAKGKIRR
jgi:hypothetical protein